MLKLGCLADDWACARDLANNLVAAGMCVTWTQGVPPQPLAADDDAVVVYLQPRQHNTGDVVNRALQAMMWLRECGAQQIVWAINPALHVGPNAEPRYATLRVVRALMAAMGIDFTVVVPTDPERNARLLKGHLFVGDALLADTLPNSPNLPPVDSNLLRVMGDQLPMPVTLVNIETVQAGTVTLQTHLAAMRIKGPGVALVDASDDTDLSFIAQAVRSQPLVVASPALGIVLPQNFGLAPNLASSQLPKARGLRAIVCGSLAPTTAQQIKFMHAAGYPVMALDVLKVAKYGTQRVTDAAMAWAAPLLPNGPVLFYSTLNELAREAAGSLLGTSNAALMVSDCLALISRRLVEAGVRQLVLAGHGTGERCLRQMGLRQMMVGPQMEDGAPWCFAPLGTPREGQDPADIDGVHVLVKSGGVGEPDYFLRAFEDLLLPQ